MEKMNFFKYSDKSVRLTGRWHDNRDCVITTTTGASAEFSFYGDMVVLHFDLTDNKYPYPHLWMIADDGAKVEVQVQSYMRVHFKENDVHTIKFIVKSETETYSRWKMPLIDKVMWKGFEAQESVEISKDIRKTIEFVGDSITEGVLIDEKYRIHPDNRFNRVLQDDVTATYAWLTAEKLNLIPIIVGYGAVGVTKGGNGGVPRGGQAYPYCYDSVENQSPGADYIIVNYGANDRNAGETAYFSGLGELLKVISEKNPGAKLIMLGAFCGAYADTLEHFIGKYNQENGTNIVYISTKDWIPPEPLHPSREGHAAVADKLVKAMKEHFPEL